MTSYYSRLSELDIPLVNIARNFSANVVADELADGGGEIEIYRVDVFCYEAVLQGPVSRFAHFIGFGVEAEVVEEHGCGEDAAEWVGDIFSCGLRVGAVDGFEEGRAFADGGGGQQAEG